MALPTPIESTIRTTAGILYEGRHVEAGTTMTVPRDLANRLIEADRAELAPGERNEKKGTRHA